jgi:leader peptidase (prepilin peptidase) / N-methyltransferase
MGLAAAAFVFAPALAVGSFLNVVAARLPLKRSLVSPGSACMSCGHEIAWYDNIPVLSWLVLRGRCRSCSASIPFRYPAVELATGLLVAGCFWRFGLTADAGIASLVCIALVTVSATDIEHQIIPNTVVLPAAVLVLALNTAVHPSPEWIIAGAAAAAFLLAAALAYPAGMGIGDVKLALLMGVALGKTVSVALMLGMFAALVPSVYLLARHGMAARKMKIPFGPFLALGAVVALFVGHEILNFYWSLSSHG